MDLFSVFFWSFVIGGLIIGVIAYLFIRVIKKADNDVQSNPDKYLDQVFDGRETAVYKIINWGGTLKFEQVLSGAEKRGYDLHAQNKDSDSMTTLVFKKVG